MEFDLVSVSPAVRCRLCAANEPIKIDIFGDEGMSRNLVDKIETCLPLIVRLEDQLPKSLCYRCMYLLEKYYDFRRSCVNAHEMLEVCVKQFELENAKLRHGMNSHSEQTALTKPSESLMPKSVTTSDTTTPKPFTECEASASKLSESVSPPTVTATFSLEHKSLLPSLTSNSLPNPESLLTKAVVPSESLESATCNSLSAASQTPIPMAPESVVSNPDTASAPPISTVSNSIISIDLDSDSSVEEVQVLLSAKQRRKSTKPRKLAAAPQNNITESLVKPFACMLCDKSFSLKNALSRHFNACHGIEIQDVGDIKRAKQNTTSAETVSDAVGGVKRKHSSPSDTTVDNDVVNSDPKRSKKSNKINAEDEINGGRVRSHSSMEIGESSSSTENSMSRKRLNTSREDNAECIEVDAYPLPQAQLVCEICERPFNDKSNLWLHLLYTHKDAAPFACGVCLKLACDNATLSRHWKSHFNSQQQEDSCAERRRYSCEICGRQDNSRKKLVNHIKIHVFDTSFDPDMLIINNSDYLNGKYLDFTDFTDDVSNFTSSMTVGDPYPSYYPCNLCYKAFETEETLAKHRKTVHKIHAQCQMCTETFSSEEELMRHVTSEHYDGNHMLNFDVFYCKYCSQDFSLLNDVEEHQLICSTKFSNYRCELCKKSFATEDSLVRHKKSDHFEKSSSYNNYHCELCKKSFSSEDCLVKHKKGAHKNDDDDYDAFYFCEFCGTSHATKVARWRHVNSVHSSETSIRCSYKNCEKLFASEVLAVDHRSHHDLQGDSPHTCELCGKLWNSRVEFWKHFHGVHGEMLALVCGICLKIFGETEMLVEHVKASHELQEGCFHCKVCARQYANQNKLTKHETIHLAITPGTSTEPTSRSSTSKHSATKPAVESTPSTSRPSTSRPSTSKYARPRPSTSKAPVTKNATTKLSTSAEPKVSTSKSEEYICEICPPSSHHFPSLADLATHRRTVHTLCPCDLCPKFYARNSHLWKHVNRKHKGREEVTCNICFKMSASQGHLEEHRKKTHKDVLPLQKTLAEDSPINMVENKTKEETNIQPEDEVEEDVSLGLDDTLPVKKLVKQYLKYPCAFCTKTFIKRYLHKKHQSCCSKRAKRKVLISSNSKLQPQQSICVLCDNTEFSTFTALFEHIKSSHPQLQCSTCLKFTRSLPDLQIHVEQHKTLPHPFYCELCGEVLTNEYKTTLHMNQRHKEHAALMCRVCFSILDDADTLKVHMTTTCKVKEPKLRIKRSYSCDKCPVTFSKPSELSAHKHRQHMFVCIKMEPLDKVVECLVCTERFQSQEELATHRQENDCGKVNCRASMDQLKNNDQDEDMEQDEIVEVHKIENLEPQTQVTKFVEKANVSDDDSDKVNNPAEKSKGLNDNDKTSKMMRKSSQKSEEIRNHLEKTKTSNMENQLELPMIPVVSPMSSDPTNCLELQKDKMIVSGAEKHLKEDVEVDGKIQNETEMRTRESLESNEEAGSNVQMEIDENTEESQLDETLLTPSDCVDEMVKTERLYEGSENNRDDIVDNEPHIECLICTKRFQSENGLMNHRKEDDCRKLKYKSVEGDLSEIKLEQIEGKHECDGDKEKQLIEKAKIKEISQSVDPMDKKNESKETSNKKVSPTKEMPILTAIEMPTLIQNDAGWKEQPDKSMPTLSKSDQPLVGGSERVAETLDALDDALDILEAQNS